MTGGEGFSSGRERAIEALIDSEPNGASYRAARILEEVVPHALLNRPNLITRSALIDQAHSLSEYEVDSFEKYTEVFGLASSEIVVSRDKTSPETPSDESTERVLRHHSKIVTAKSETKAAAAPIQLVATLERLYGSTLMQSALEHSAFSEELPAEDMIANLESIVGNVCRQIVDDEEDGLQGVLLATLSVLTGSVLDHVEEEEPDLRKGKSVSTSSMVSPRQDPTDMPALQVGALMSLLQAGSEQGPYSLDDKILKYLGEAAAVHEQRIEIQKSRLLARMEEEEQKADDKIPIVPITPNAGAVEDHGNKGMPSAVVDDDDDDGMEMAGSESALGLSVFDQIISAVAGDDTSLDGVDRAALRLEAGPGADSSDSEDDSDNDSDHIGGYSAPHVVQDDDEEDEDDDSSSDEEEDEEPEADEEPNHDDEDEDDGEEEDEEDDDDIGPGSTLRQALELSLANARMKDEGEDEDRPEEGPEDEANAAGGFSTPRRASNRSSHSAKSRENENDDPADDPPLPELPPPPAHYPYWSSIDTVADVDDKKNRGDNLNPCLDPNSLSRFGSMKASYVIIRLLQHSLSTVINQSFAEKKRTKKESNGELFKVNSVPGGMGAALFGSEARLFSPSDRWDRYSDNEEGRSSISVQLLVAACLIFFDCRKDAIEGLRKAVLAEQRNAQGDDQDFVDNGESTDTPLSDEEDDDNTVALAMTLNYHENRDSSRSSPSQSDSLESKGMTRKAAAAGFDAAMRIKSLKKKTDAWKDRVKFYSYCTLLAMKIFRTFVQNCVAERLDTRIIVEESNGCFLKNLEKVVPRGVSAKLSSMLSALMSIAEFRSLAMLVSGDEAGEVEELFMPIPLYREALVAWGECIPLFFTTPPDREQVLRDLITDCFSKARSVHHFRAFDTLSSMPSTEEESQLYKLDIICRRFCVTDLLDDVVVRPLCFNPDAVKTLSEGSPEGSISPCVATSLVQLLYSSSLKTNGACLRFLRRFNMALCHRCNVRGILWDGLYACSQLESDDVAVAAISTMSSETVRVSSNPSSSLLFDSTKCSDSIAILSNHADSPAASNGSSAHQRASKVWGTVISSAYFNPKSGIHRWAVRLDRCERGHVFVGVSTSQASMRTYVGGDKYGWGVIGTQALWHDRRKIRGDYGATFRTGSVIVVTLDTDAGTLSFSSWKDTNSSSGSFSLDPHFPGLTSPRRPPSGGGALEDWGVAFEGLPLDAKLYPAVGLYQRDDRVTLLSVESGAHSGGQSAAIEGELFAGGSGYYPRVNAFAPNRDDFSAHMSKIRIHNDTLSWDSIEFVESMLLNAVESIESRDMNHRNLGLHTILPSIASAICLLPPSIPVLSERFALHLLPMLTNCINALNELVEDQQIIFPSMLKEGKWVIRATGSLNNAGNTECEEYVVTFTNKMGNCGEYIGFLGNGIGTTGKSKNGIVSIIGTVYGSSVHFVEEWADGVDETVPSAGDETSSSCVISARLSLDGFKLEGTYRNVQYGTTGHIAAVCLADGEASTSTVNKSTMNDTLRCQAILRLAHGHLATILGNDTAGDHVRSPRIGEAKNKLIHTLISSSPFCEGLRDANHDIGEKVVRGLREFYSGRGRVARLLNFELLTDQKFNESDFSSQIVDVSRRDEGIRARNGGKGSLSSLCPAVYTEARMQVISALLHHCFPNQKLDAIDNDGIDRVWTTALKILEDQVRGALSDSSLVSGGTKARCSTRCQQVTLVSRFLLSLHPNTEPPLELAEILNCMTLFYAEVRNDDDIKAFREEFDAAMRRACLKLVALNQILEVLPTADSKLSLARVSVVECTSVAIPRLLGRGANKLGSLALTEPVGIVEADSHYLATLRGSGHTFRHALRASVHSILSILGQILKQGSSYKASVHLDSLVLSIIPVFACSISPNDIRSLILRSGIQSSLVQILASHRSALRKTAESESRIGETSRSLLVGEMRAIVFRDMSRVVLQTALSTAHTIAHQVLQWTRLFPGSTVDDASFKALSESVSLILNEFKEIVSLMEDSLRNDLDSFFTKQGTAHYNKWVVVSYPECSEMEKSKRKKPQGKASRSGLSQLLEKGTLVLAQPHSPTTPTKSMSKSTTSSSSQTSDESQMELAHSCGFACHQHLSRCLDILNCIVRYPEARQALLKVESWIDVFFAAIGLSLVRGNRQAIVGCNILSKEVKIPVRYRGRIIRFLSSMLVETPANDFIVEGLLSVAGRAIDVETNSLFGHESLFAGDVIACLRTMYNTSSPEWRIAIDKMIANYSTTDTHKHISGNITLGILTFIAGSIRTIGPGSHVLLKPAAAAPLSPDSHSAPSSSKSGSGSSAPGGSGGVTSHHVVGTGTEGIVAGLCRTEAAAGVVSSVDTKTGICEVILLERIGSELEPFPQERQRSTLTVRALRSPLAEVAQAEQVALALAPNFPVVDLLQNALLFAITVFDTVANDVGDESKQTKSQVVGFHFALLAFRAATVLLSDDRLLAEFCKHDTCKQLFSSLLCIAGKNQGFPTKVLDAAKIESLASLPIHEGKYHRFVRMLAELQVRRAMLELTPDDTWNKRVDELRLRRKKKSPNTPERKEKKTFEQSPPPSTDVMETTSTFPASSVQSSVAPSRRQTSQSSVSSNSTEEEEESEAAATAAAHLREAAIAQMAELGLPRSWSELALRRTGGTNIEAAVHFCLERGGDMERLLAEERERERMMQRSSSGSSRRRGARDDSARSSHLLRQLLEMGFPSRWCAEALAATRNNVDEALTWILTNGERLSAEDEGMDDEDEDADDGDFDDDDDDEEDDEEDAEGDDSEEVERVAHVTSGDCDQPAEASVASQDFSVSSPPKRQESSPAEKEIGKAWCGSVTPLRFISGRSIINPRTLAVSGLPTGGFSSVGTKGILLTTGKWYYEAILETAGCLQIGWADGSFSGHCHAERGDGCGDGPSSWAYDGWRRYRWHASATEWGCRWKEGDVIGCLVDMDQKVVSFTVNGKGEDVGMGVAFSGQGFRPCGGVYACVSFNRKEKLRLILGGKGTEPFKYDPPEGYRGIGEAILEAVCERQNLLSKEKVLTPEHTGEESEHRFLCDFSDGEHGHELFAWQHRYYGSDASVHLGSGRSSKLSSGTTKSGSGSVALTNTSPSTCVGLQVEKAWSSNKDAELEPVIASEPVKVVKNLMHNGLQSVADELVGVIVHEALLLGMFYSRKLILHLIVTFGQDFEPSLFGKEGDLDAARTFWRVIDSCVSLRSAGWVGEAGAMAIAAEALGLGISSTDHQSKIKESDRPGHTSVQCGDEIVPLPVAGTSQLLSTVRYTKSCEKATLRETWRSLASCAEASIGADGGGGPLVFLQQGLQRALCQSASLRNVLVAIIRRSVRLLAVVDYSGDDASASESPEDDDMDSSSSAPKATEDAKDNDENTRTQQPDARLTCFLTGLLLSAPVQSSIPETQELHEDLLEAWSIGLLSASAPWRMVCALTASGILNSCPAALRKVVQSLPTVMGFYERLQNTVLRRVWAERAAVPVCSRYVQAFIELLASVRRAELTTPALRWERLQVDAATPLPLQPHPLNHAMISEGISPSWEWDDGWVSNDAGWEVWIGSVDYMVIDWRAPSRSAVRTLMDGGEGPPMLREGCTVVRGLDWDDVNSGCKTFNEDGKKEYEVEKAEREKEKKILEEQAADDPAEQDAESGDVSNDEQPDPESADEVDGALSPSDSVKDTKQKKKRKKIPNPKLPIGTVIAVESWNGIPAMARRVKWHLTGEEGIYRYGGDGGRYDICHVEVNEKGTRIRKRHPLPESAEQCAARHGFGSGKKHSVLLRLRRIGSVKQIDVDGPEYQHEGVLEWPDFGAGVRVTCVQYPDGAVLLKEHELLFGSKDSGWEARFGQASFVPGTEIMLSPTGSSRIKDLVELDTKSSFMTMYQEMLGSTSYHVDGLRHRSDGGKIRVTLEMRMLRGRRPHRKIGLPKQLEYTARPPPPLCFDRDYHASSMSLSRDGRTLTCISPEGRGSAFASVGFTKGVVYWEVKLEQADIGSVFIGVAEKPSGSGSAGGSSFGDGPPRLNRWLGWGFVNFRATYTAGAERVYGAHCHNDDTVGVLLDCDAGRVSFFYDGLKYGEHILNDLGCAFENISPFGFNADGCGSGGAGQGAPSGIDGGRGGRYPAHGVVRPRALWPVIGLRNPGDRVTLSTKWTTSFGSDGAGILKNVLAIDELITSYCDAKSVTQNGLPFPDWFVKEAFDEYRRWHSGRWYRTTTRGTGAHSLATVGLDVDLDCSPLACAAACAAIGLRQALLAGDRVKVKRSAGRPLELAEEAVVLGAHQCRLYYRLVSQKSEGGSLTEGGGRAWFWDESEVVGESLQIVGEGKGGNIELPLIDRFRCLSSGGIRIVYEGGAVMRSDLEIFNGSSNLGSVPHDTVIHCHDVLERRVNSCGVIRYRIRYEPVGEGWISSRIRGGKEEPIIEAVHSPTTGHTVPKDHDPCYATPEEAAIAWHEKLRISSKQELELERPQDCFDIQDLGAFKMLLTECVLPGKQDFESDAVVAKLVSAISDCSEEGDAVECSFKSTSSAVSFAVASANGGKIPDNVVNTIASEAAATVLASANAHFASSKALMARIAILRAINRRLRNSLPWLSVRPSQEGTAILGGLCGQGASVERAGRSKLTESMDLWVQVPCIASRMRTLKGLFFTSVKVNFLESVTLATTTPTPLSHDEYELPREIRTVRVNRLKARRAMAGEDVRLKRKHSVFAQLQTETRSWGGAALRRGFVAKGHGGQKRAFKVKLIGEGVNDYSGPYREVFTDAIHEVLEMESSGQGSLGVLDPTPNNGNEIGEDRELFMFSRGDKLDVGKFETELSDEELRIRQSFSSLTMARDESSREVEESLLFLGRLVGTSCRHGIPVDLPLPLTIVWNAISEEKFEPQVSLREIDVLASKHPGEGDSLLFWQHRMLSSFVDGLSNLLPVELLPLLSGEELRAMLCGNPDVDVDLLKRVVEYEGYDESDAVVDYFWEALREMSNSDRKKFLQFVWARTRLPNKESDFDAPFKIQKDPSGSDTSLPSASTCFFSLTLPEYTSKELLREKLMFAIENVCTMESDYVTNDSEVGEGWRGI